MTESISTLSSLLKSKQIEPGVDSSGASSPRLVCDINSSPQFWSVEYRSQLPFMHVFGAGPVHGYSVEGNWDLNRATAEWPGAVYRSLRSGTEDRTASDWQKIIFQFGPRCFLCVDSTSAAAYDVTVEGAKELLAAFEKEYRITQTNPAAGCFQLLKVSYDIQCETVVLPETTALDDENFELRYGAHGLDWHNGFVEQLRSRDRGISILEGPPGTGKTHYLRHLMSVLRETHRFYFLPPNNLSALSQAEFVEFWSGQRRRHPMLRFVVILEDCESAIAARSGENNDVVSTILNLSDGMLSDFLKIQIICTVNCRLTEIDQALLRPGRLTCHRTFPRLSYIEAQGLAARLGKCLPQMEDYSLAEIFAGTSAVQAPRSRIGFAG